jgi:hypothetical protein
MEIVMANFNIEETVENLVNQEGVTKALSISSTYRSKSKGERKVFWNKVYLNVKIMSLNNQIKELEKQLKEGFNE